jgi:hypothetical protein
MRLAAWSAGCSATGERFVARAAFVTGWGGQSVGDFAAVDDELGPVGWEQGFRSAGRALDRPDPR